MAEQFPTPRSQQTNPNRATKICYFHKDGDPRAKTFKVAINQKKYSTIEALQDDLNNKIDLPFGVRSIYTPKGRHAVRNTDTLQNNMSYICSTHPTKAKGLDVKKLESVKPWHGGGRPASGKRVLYDLLKQDRIADRIKRRNMGEIVTPTTLSTSSEKPPSYLSKSPRTPKRITVMKNANPQTHHILLINRNTLMSYEQVLQDIGVMFHMPSAKKLFTADGKEVRGLNDIINGPSNYVVCGREDFIPLSAIPQQNGKNKRKAAPGELAREKMKQKQDRLEKTKGCWQVWIKTNEIHLAETSARVSLTVYGDQGNSGPIMLGEDGDDEFACFTSGSEDQFKINVGKIGEIFKIRLAHDDSGDSAGYLCDEVRMQDENTGEELLFTCGRWMSREVDDFEICREMPAVRPGEHVLPIIVYQVMVVTGDVWNASTSGNVYITMYGMNGDTGVRQLLNSSNSEKFLKGQIDLFSLEAVSLGEIVKVTIGHDGEGPGFGWFLDKIIIQDGNPAGPQQWVFPCKRWLDEGEEDTAIVRELKNINEYRPDVFEKQQFEYEKWKLQPNCQVMLFSAASGKVLRLKPDGTLDLSDDHSDSSAVFNVILKSGMKRCFQSANNPHLHLAIDNNRPNGQGRGGPLCEFKVLVQEDRSVRLESAKTPNQYLAFGNNGRAMNPTDAKPEFSKFFVYCKGMFRDQGVVLLCTSVIQSLGIVDSDNKLVATGKLNQLAQFRVHKVSPGVRMFESVVYPGKFIRCKSGVCDANGTGDKACQFKIEKKKERGYVSFESLASKGQCLGMMEDGTVKATVLTGGKNMRFYPQVIDFGRMKTDESIVSQSPVPVPIKPIKHKKAPRRVSADTVSLATTAPPQVYDDGDWKVVITTVESAVNAEVILNVYGEDGIAGPIYLGTSEEGLFHTGHGDEFKVNLAPAGKIYKIRLELLQVGQGSPSWKVKQVKMKDMNTKETLTFKFNRWLSRTEDDLDVSREMPAVRPSQDVLPLVVYKVHVFTGMENGADTDSNLYIQLFGVRGDSGKRGLVQSENEEMFQPGQEDTFSIEAVCMDQLTHCRIGHDADGIGEGWFCEKIIVTNPQTGEQWLFACNKWLDSGLGDGKMERTLKRTDIQDDHMPDQNGTDEVPEEDEWDLWITTGAESEFQSFFDMEMWVYGSEGNSGPLIINGNDDTANFFKSGATDETVVQFGDLGELYKIRVGAFFTSDVGSWFLEKVKMKNRNTKETLIFNCGRWLSLEKDDGDTWREMPVVAPGRNPLPIVVYTIEIYTGTLRGASTSATVYVHMFGTRGDSGQRELNCSATNHPKWFKTGQMDAFEIEAVSLDDIVAIDLEHNAKEKGKGWYVNKVIIKEGRYDDIKAVEHELEPKKNGMKKKKAQEKDSEFPTWHFPCMKWFDVGQEDGAIKRKLEAASAPKVQPTPPSSDKTKKGDWNVLVTSGKQTEMASQDRIRFWVYGDRDVIGPIPLGEDDPDKYYRPGATDKFKVNLKNIGTPYKLRIGYEPDEGEEELTNWFIDKIVMNDLSINEKLTFKVQRWLSRQQEDKETWRECPVVRPGKQPLPVIIYTVEIHTGDIPGSDTDTTPFIKLNGTRGDCGQRVLTADKELNGHEDLFEKGQVDIFHVEAVSLDELTSVTLGHNESVKGAGWYVKKVVVKESSYENIQAIEAKKAKLKNKKSKKPPPKEEEIRTWYFPCDKWFDVGMDDGEIERELLADEMPDDGPPPPEGNWKLTTVTGPEEYMSLKDNEVLLYVYGSRGKSDPIPVGKENRDKWFHAGATDDFDITLKQLGEIYKVRIGFFPEIQDDHWHLESLTMKDVINKEVLQFKVNQWFSLERDDCDTWRELPAVYPGKQPLSVITYTVEVITGNEPGAGTEAQPHIHVFGSRGDTGQRLLYKDVTGKKKPFEQGSTGIFEIKAVDLDEIEKITVGHDGHGKGAGWYCEKVLIKEGSYEEIKALEGKGDENANNNANKRPYRAWEFPVNSWMDEGMGDGKLEVEVQGHPMPEEEEEEMLDEGEMEFSDIDDAPDLLVAEDDEAPADNYEVTVVTGKQKNMALEQNDVVLYVYGEEGVTDPIPLGVEDRDKKFLAGAKDKFNVNIDEIGEIYKVRIGYEPTLPEDGWYLEKVSLKHLESQDELHFKAGRWLSQSEDDLDTWREYAAVYPGKEPMPVLVYTVEVYTGNKPGSDTESQPYVKLVGSKGDSGNRLLFNDLTKNEQKFQQGQMDVFQVEAVTLEDITSVVLGHRSQGKGAGWYVEKVIVKEGDYETVKALDEKKETEKQKKEQKNKKAKKGQEEEEDEGPGYKMWYFPCDRWFDQGMEDGLIERVLEPGEAPIVEEVGPDGNWQVTLVTGPEDKMALKQNDVQLYVYGSRKVSDPIPLGSEERDKYFRPGASDQFNITLLDLGEIYKIRVGYAVEEKVDGWFLEKVILKHIENEDELHFKAERWCSQSEEDCDTWREFPAIYPGKDPLPVLIYTVEIYTGDLPGSDTSAEAYVHLNGCRGDSGQRLLFKELTDNKKPFQAGQCDIYEIEAVSLDEIESVIVGHNGHGKGAGWYIDHVIIKEGRYADIKAIDDKKKEEEQKNDGKKAKSEEEETYKMWYFPCARWFDEGMDDGKIERMLTPGDPPSEAGPEGNWDVTIVTGPEENMSLKQNDVLLYVYGYDKISDPIPLGKVEREKYYLPGAIDNFKVTLDELGEIYKIRVGYFAEVKDEEWYLEKVTLKNLVNQDELHFDSGRWLSQSKEDKDTWREFPAVHPGKEPLPILIYTVEIYTGNEPGAETEAEPYIELRGSRGDTGRRLLYREVSENEKPFQKGQKDVYEVEAVSIDELKGLLIGHNNEGKGAGWFVDHIVVKEGSYEETKAIDEKREEGASGNDENTNNNARTKATKRPDPKKSERQDKSDKTKDETKDEQETYRMWYFPCNKWFDTGMDDNEIERLLEPGDPPEEEKEEEKEEQKEEETVVAVVEDIVEEQKESPPTEGAKLWVKTADDSKSANNSKMLLVVYGDKGRSKDMVLHKDGAFAAGNTDEFDLELEEVGEPYKIRVERDNDDEWEGWHLDQVKLQTSEGQEYLFEFDRWMDRSQDDHDIVRELPFKKEGEEPLPIQCYEVTIFTGDHWAAATDAKAFLTLFGSKGDSGKRWLYHTDSNTDKFMKGQTDSFIVEAVTLENLEKIEIGHSGTGFGSGWYIDKVVIKEKEGENTNMEYIFPCGMWFDDQIGDKLTCRTLELKDTVDATEAPNSLEDEESTGEWKVTIKTSDTEDAGTKAQVFITGCGDAGSSEPQPLGQPGDPNLDTGKEGEFVVQFGEIGELEKVRLEHDNSGDSPDWHVEKITLQDTKTKEEFKVYVNRWFSQEHDDGMTCREVQISKPLTPTRPSLLYQVALVTGDNEEAGTSAEVSINITGENGETGYRKLNKSLTCDEPFKPGQTDIFHLDAVHLGRLEKVMLKHDGKTPETKWLVEKVIVKETTWAITQATFNCGEWVAPVREPETAGHSVSLTTLEFVTELPAYKEGEQPEKSSGEWTLWAHTSEDQTADVNGAVSIMVFGTKGESQLIPLKSGKTEEKEEEKEDKKEDSKKKSNKKEKDSKKKDDKAKDKEQENDQERSEDGEDKLKAGAVDEFKLSCGDIGEVYKIRIIIDSKDENTEWFIKKLKMKDDQTGQEFHFFYNDSVKVSKENPDGMVELPAIWPDIEPLQGAKYTLFLETGNEPRAETDAEVTCNLVGSYGESGPRKLKTSKSNDTPFCSGQVDEFDVQAVDLGPIKKVILGHSSQGRGNGWLCERLSIRCDLAEEEEVIFPVHSWIDTGCQERLMQQEFSTSTSVKIEAENSKGPWKCSIVMASEEDLKAAKERQQKEEEGEGEKKEGEEETKKEEAKKEDSKQEEIPKVLGIGICFTGDKGEPDSQAMDVQLEDLALGKTSECEIKHEDVGKLSEIRVMTHLDGPPQWLVEKVTLTDENTKEVIVLNFKDDLGKEVSAIERPVARAATSLPAVLDYMIRIQVQKEAAKNEEKEEEKKEEEKEEEGKDPLILKLVGNKGDSGFVPVPVFSINADTKEKEGESAPMECETEINMMISAVDLGNMEKICINGKPQGFRLQKVTVLPKKFECYEYVFRIDKLEDDEPTEIKVCQKLPHPVAIPVMPEELPKSEGTWKVKTVTGKEENHGATGPVVVVLCGYETESEPQPLALGKEQVLQAGAEEEFEIKIEPSMDFFKVRLGFQEEGQDKGKKDAEKEAKVMSWFVEKMHFEDTVNHDWFELEINDWIRLDENSDGWKEFPVQWPAIKLPSVQKYEVHVKTADVENAETSAIVYLNVHGHQGMTGNRILKKSNKKILFQRGQIDVFELEAVDLEDPQKVIVGHTMKDQGAGWLLDSIMIKKKGDDENEFVFKNDRWLDAGQDDKLIERELKVSPPEPPPENNYRVIISTSDMERASTDAPVTVTIFGDKGDTGPIELEGEGKFQRGATDDFEIHIDEEKVGKIYKIRVQQSDTTAEADMHLSKVELESLDGKTKVEFPPLDRWLSSTDDDGDVVRELPAIWPDDPEPKKVIKYHLEIHTGDESRAPADSKIHMTLTGDKGDSGKRYLNKNKEGTPKFDKAKVDIFSLEAVDLGVLEKVAVGYDQFDENSGWQCKKVVVKESEESQEQFVGTSDIWLDNEGEDGLTEREIYLKKE